MHLHIRRNAALSLVLLVQFTLVGQATAQDKTQRSNMRVGIEQTHPTTQILDINNNTIWIRNDAMFPWVDPHSGENGSFPKGTANVVFAQGFLWGGLVRDGREPVLRVNGSTYQTGLDPGRVLRDASGRAIGPDDRTDMSKYHVWRVVRKWKDLGCLPARDYATNEECAQFLRHGVWQFFGTDPNSASPAQMDDIADQYEYDWNNWPAEWGAPYEDVDGNGRYDPAVDIPGYPGASQTLWRVMNDLRPGTSEGSYGSPAIGVENQTTVWGYEFAADAPLGNIAFIQSRLIYTGLPDTPVDARIDSMYAVWWSDPDVGDFSTDFSGADTLLGLGYTYNSLTRDAVYDQFGLAPPAVGWDFLQGPITAEGDTLGMTAFVYFAAGSDISDPTLSQYSGSLQWYNLMRGLRPRPEYPAGDPFIDPFTGEATTFALTGDPVTGRGWIDGIQLPAGDRRMVQSTGPFTMALGDTVDVVVGQIAAVGTSNISSVNLLKYYDLFAQFAYDQNFDLPSPPPTPTVSVTELDGEIVLNWGVDNRVASQLENFSSAGFDFEGYNVYQLPSRTASVREGVKVATFDKVNLISTIIDNAFDEQTGFVIQRPVQLSPNEGLQRAISIKDDGLRSRPLANGVEYYFAVTAYSYLDTDEPVPFRMMESPLNILAVTPQPPRPGESIPDEVATGNKIEVTQTAGASHVVPEVEVVDPRRVQGGQYTIAFEYYNPYAGTTSPTLGPADTLHTVPADLFESTQYGDENAFGVGDPFPLRWAVLRDGSRISDWFPQIDPAGPVPTTAAPIIDGMRIYVKHVGDLSIDWTSSGTRWITGVNWGGELFFGGVDIGHNFFGSTLPVSDVQSVVLEFAADTTSGPVDGWASQGALYVRGLGYGLVGLAKLPFRAYEVDAAGNRRQVNVSVSENDADPACRNARWDVGMLQNPDCPDAALGMREYVFVHKSDYNGGVDYDDDANWGPGADVMWAMWAARRGTFEFMEGPFDLWFIRENALTSNDVYTFAAPALVQGDPQLAAQAVREINVFPNPYLGFSALEANRAQKFVTFTHLPSTATIRIFALNGTMVRRIDHDTDTQFRQWDLTNQDGIPVASGVYIVHVSTDHGEKVLKMAIVQEEQILPRY